MTSGIARLEEIVRLIGETCIEQEKYFSDLDSVVGDGDFGYSLARGFENLIEQWDELRRDDAGAFLQSVAVCLSARIGGTSGPIWGTAFLRAGSAVKGEQSLGASDVAPMLRAAIEGIKSRGGADIGDKTLLDALAPVTDEIERQVAAGAQAADVAAAAAKSARSAAEATSALVARRGRASYSGERSIGAPDPGAVAVAVLAERISETWR
jgi:dihydroxyacetone kinase-like protein